MITCPLWHFKYALKSRPLSAVFEGPFSEHFPDPWSTEIHLSVSIKNFHETLVLGAFGI